MKFSLFGCLGHDLNGLIVSAERAVQAASVTQANYLWKHTNWVNFWLKKDHLFFRIKKIVWTHLNQSDRNSNTSQNGRFRAQQCEQSRFASFFQSILFRASFVFGQIQATWFRQLSAVENGLVIVWSFNAAAFQLKSQSKQLICRFSNRIDINSS